MGHKHISIPVSDRVNHSSVLRSSYARQAWHHSGVQHFAFDLFDRIYWCEAIRSVCSHCRVSSTEFFIMITLKQMAKYSSDSLLFKLSLSVLIRMSRFRSYTTRQIHRQTKNSLGVPTFVGNTLSQFVDKIG